jgi:hypothetical protein
LLQITELNQKLSLATKSRPSANRGRQQRAWTWEKKAARKIFARRWTGAKTNSERAGRTLEENSRTARKPKKKILVRRAAGELEIGAGVWTESWGHRAEQWPDELRKPHGNRIHDHSGEDSPPEKQNSLTLGSRLLVGEDSSGHPGWKIGNRNSWPQKIWAEKRDESAEPKTERDEPQIQNEIEINREEQHT